MIFLALGDTRGSRLSYQMLTRQIRKNIILWHNYERLPSGYCFM